MRKIIYYFWGVLDKKRKMNYLVGLAKTPFVSATLDLLTYQTSFVKIRPFQRSPREQYIEWRREIMKIPLWIWSDCWATIKHWNSPSNLILCSLKKKTHITPSYKKTHNSSFFIKYHHLTHEEPSSSYLWGLQLTWWVSRGLTRSCWCFPVIMAVMICFCGLVVFMILLVLFLWRRTSLWRLRCLFLQNGGD